MGSSKGQEAIRHKRKEGLKLHCHMSYLHKTLEGWPECDAGEGRGAGGRWVVCGLCVHVRRGGLGGGGGLPQLQANS